MEIPKLTIDRKYILDLEKIENYFVWRVDQKYIITSLSPKIEAILGFEPADMLNKNIFDLVIDDQKENFKLKIGVYNPKKSNINNIQALCKSKNNNIVHLAFDAVVVADEDNNSLGYEGISYKIEDFNK